MPGRAPPGWKAVRLGKMCALSRDADPGSDAYVGIEHIVPGRNGVSGTASAGDFATHRPFRERDILYAKLGPAANKVWLATCAGRCSTDILPIRAEPGLILPEFLVRVMAGPRFVGHAVSTSSGTIMPRTSWRDIQRFTVHVPPLREQQRIASILSNVDALVANVETLSVKYKTLQYGLSQEIFGTSVKNLKWKSVELSSLTKGKSQYGIDAPAVPYDNTLARYIRIADIRSDGTLDNALKASVKLRGNEKYLLERNDLLFARAGTVGRTMLVKNGLTDAIFVNTLIRFNIDSTKVDPLFLEQYTRSAAYRAWIVSVTAQSVVPNINARQFAKLLVPLPPRAKQKQTASILSGVDAVIENYRLYQQQLERLKRGLMQKLLSGKIRV